MRVFKLRETRGLKNEEVVVGQIVLEKKGGALTVFTQRPPGHGRFPFLSQAIPASQIWPVCLAPPSIHTVACVPTGR